MASVYGAFDVALKRRVALKVLHANGAEPFAMQRFEREAGLLAKIEHPNLVRVYSIEHIGESLLMVMSLVEGETLSARIRRLTRLDFREALAIVKQLASGLEALHLRGIIHRDVKPSNVIVNDSGHVTLLDLGIAWTADESFTRPGMLVGTVRYMSPEHIRSQPLDARADVYSLALLFFELVTGRMPFDCLAEVDWFQAHLKSVPFRLSQARPELGQRYDFAIAAALHKTREQRPPSTLAFVQSLEHPTRPAWLRFRREIFRLAPALLVTALSAGATWMLFRPVPKALPPPQEVAVTASSGVTEAPSGASLSPISPAPAPVPVEPVNTQQGPAVGTKASSRQVKDTASLRLTSKSGWAEVMIDGKQKVYTPAVVKLSSGAHSLVIKTSDGRTSRRQIKLTAGEAQTLRL